MSPTKTAKARSAGSPSKMDNPANRRLAYQAYFQTLDAENLRNLCKNEGLEMKGSKTDLVERLSAPTHSGSGHTRARSGSPAPPRKENKSSVPLHDRFKNMEPHHEWKLLASVAAVMGLLLILALVFHSAGGSLHAFLDHFGGIGQAIKGAVGMGKGGAASASGGK